MKISYSDLQREIARYLGFDRSSANWDATQSLDVSDIILAGIRDFYWPPMLEGVPVHKWSFLCPVDTVTLSVGNGDYDLPDDFVRLCSDFTFLENDKKVRLANVDESEIRAMRSTNHRQSVPLYCALRPKSQLEDRYEVLLYPTPDDPMTIEFRYEKMPEALSDGNPYHLGSAAHSQTLLMACLMNADRVLNKESVDASQGGLHMQRFAAALRTSIGIDQQVYS